MTTSTARRMATTVTAEGPGGATVDFYVGCHNGNLSARVCGGARNDSGDRYAATGAWAWGGEFTLPSGVALAALVSDF